MAMDDVGPGAGSGRLQHDGRQSRPGRRRIGCRKLLTAGAVAAAFGLAACNVTIGSPVPDVRESDSDGMQTPNY